MREVVLDTETTGLDPKNGDRIVEIGAVELFNHMPTGKFFHKYLDPEIAMPQEALAVHGLSDDFLKDKPKFAEIMHEFLSFVGDSRMVIHNASFDMRFLNAELIRAGGTAYSEEQAIDTLLMARKKFPGAQNSLDALCRRFNIDNSGREKHGALLDSELLSDVYLELIGGRQPGLVLNIDHHENTINHERTGQNEQKKRIKKLKSLITDMEKANHKEFLKSLGEKSIWKKYYS